MFKLIKIDYLKRHTNNKFLKHFSKFKSKASVTFNDNKVEYPKGHKKDIDVYMKKEKFISDANNNKPEGKKIKNLDETTCLVLHPIFEDK
jgi:hypothetical protein